MTTHRYRRPRDHEVSIIGVPVVGGDQKRGGLVGGSLFAIVGLGFLLDSFGVWDFRSVYIWPLLLIAVGVSELMGRSSRERVERVRSSQLAAAEERVRIARELHDIVAHSVSLMTVQIAAARRVFQKEPEQAVEALAAAEETGRQSLNELRSIIGVLRGADASIEAASLREGDDHEESGSNVPLPGLAEVDELVSTTREAGLDVHLTKAGEEPPAPQSTQLAAYRVIQESLTNALRHAPKARVEVAIEYTTESIEVTVNDDGAGGGSSEAAPEGHGILGMRERVAAVGGTIDVGSGDSRGWRVHAVLPV